EIVDRFIERDADRVLATRADIDAMTLGNFDDFARAHRAETDLHRVEERLARNLKTESVESGCEQFRKEMDALRDATQSIRAVINRIHRRDHREENLRRADVARRFFAADVLLACLQRKAKSGTAFRVVRDADEPARHVALEFIARRKICRVRPAETERHAETLRRADSDVRTEFARWREQRQRENVRCDDCESAVRVDFFNDYTVIANRAVGARILQQRGEDTLVKSE